MIRKIFLFIIVSICVLTGQKSTAQNVGDFGTVSKGNWGSDKTWKIWNGKSWSTSTSRTPESKDVVYINHDIKIDEDIVIAELNIVSGTISYAKNKSYILTVEGDINIAAGEAFDMSTLKTKKGMTLNIGGNLFVADKASFDMVKGTSTNRVCDVIFTKANGTQMIYSDGTPATVRFNDLTVDNGSDYSSSRVECRTPLTIEGDFTVVKGTWAQTFGTLQVASVSSLVGYEALGTCQIILPSNVTVDGYLKVAGANASIYNGSLSQPTTSGSVTFANNSSLVVESGNLNIWGALNFINQSTAVVTGGSITVNNRAVVTSLAKNLPTFNIANTATFSMSGGNVIIPNYNANTSGTGSKVSEIEINSPRVNMAGGIFVIGNGAGTQAQSAGFMINSTAAFHEIEIKTGSLNNKVVLPAGMDQLVIADSLILTSGELLLDDETLFVNGIISGQGRIYANQTTDWVFTGNQNINGLASIAGVTTLGRMIVNKDAGSVINLTAAVPVEDLQIISGELYLGAALTVLDTLELSQSARITGTSDLNIQGRVITHNTQGLAADASSNIRNTVNLTFGPSAVAEYNSSSVQTISPIQYQSIEFTGTGAKYMAPGNSLRVRQNMILNNAQLNITGVTVEFNGTSAQSLPTGLVCDTLLINNTSAPFTSAVSIPAGTEKVFVKGKLTPGRGHLITNGNLVLMSDSVATANVAKQLSPSAKIVGDVIMQRYIGSGLQPRIVTIPLKSQVTSTLVQNGLPIVMDYVESRPGARGSGFNYYTATDSLKPGVGYYVYNTDQKYVAEYKGEIVDGTYQFEGISWTVDQDNRAATGWCMAGNPYPSAIDWDAPTGWTRNNISKTYFILDPITGQQASYTNGVGTNGATRYIASGQGFWVKAYSSDPSMMCTEDIKASVNPNFYKSAPSMEMRNSILRIRYTGVNFSDETVLKLESGATVNYDEGFDAEQMPTPEGMLKGYIGSVSSTGNLVINSIPAEVGTGISIPMVVFAQAAGAGNIELTDIENVAPGYQVCMEDIKTGVWYNLRENSRVDFNVANTEAGTEIHRFIIHILPEGSSIPSAETEMVVYPNPSEGQFTVEMENISGSVTVNVYDLPGKMVYSRNVDAQGAFSHQVDVTGLPSGFYFVTLESGNQKYSHKITIK